MSPVSSIYDHLTFNIHQQPTTMNQIRIPNSNCENLHLLAKRKSLPMDEHQSQIKRRYTITNISIPEPTRHPSINNPVYDKSMIKNSSTTQNISAQQQTTNPKYYRIPSSSSTMDFRPLITNGRRKFGAIPSSSSMIIIKKKSPPPMKYISYNEKPLIRSIPVDLLNNNNTVMAVSPMIPSSLSYSSSSYSSSSPSTSVSLTNVGTIFLPIQVTKSQLNINKNNNTIKYTTNPIIINEGQQGYRYVQNNIDAQKSFVYPHRENRIQLDDDLDQSTRIPSASSNGGEGYNYKSTIMMDSNVLRLIRRYDPRGSSTTGIIPRRSLENTRGLWHSVSSKADTPQSSDFSPFLSRRSLTTTYEDEIPLKQSPTSRLQRQQAFHESESPPSVPPPPPQPTSSIRPILKYTSSRSRSEFIVQPHQTEPLTIQIDPFIPPSPNESPATYQPLITTGTKRVCSALSKSEWDLRLQQEQLPIRPPSPSPLAINQQQEKESYRPTLGRSKSSMTINHTNDHDEHIDDFDEISAPILPSGSCVEKLKQLFVTKSSLDLTNPSLNKQPNDSNLHRRINPDNKIIDRSSSTPKSTPTEIQPRMINKPTTIVQDVTPIFKKPIFRSQKTIDSPESVNRSNNSIQMPSSEVSYDAYRFRRLNDQDSSTTRPRNIAKVEPYSMSTNAIRPLYQSSQPITEPTVVPSLKARIHLNSMGNTPTNSSTSSSAGSLRHSDFLIPNPAFLKPQPQPLSHSSSSYTTPPILLSESLSHGSLHQLPAANIPSYNGHVNGLTSSKNNSQDKYQSSISRDFQSSMHISSPSLSNHSIPSNLYHYRPLQNIDRKQIEMPVRSTMIEEQQQQQQQQQQQDNQQSRRRFQRRKQMKRSKSVDLYQEPSSFMSPTTNQHDLNKSYRPQRSISREYLEGGEHLSSSSSTSSLTVDLERVNRAALLRYKSLDSIAYNNRKSNLNGRNPPNNRRTVSKPTEFDFDSDDSVCGIPKPRKTIGR